MLWRHPSSAPPGERRSSATPAAISSIPEEIAAFFLVEPPEHLAHVQQATGHELDHGGAHLPAPCIGRCPATRTDPRSLRPPPEFQTDVFLWGKDHLHRERVGHPVEKTRDDGGWCSTRPSWREIWCRISANCFWMPGGVARDPAPDEPARARDADGGREETDVRDAGRVRGVVSREEPAGSDAPRSARASRDETDALAPTPASATASAGGVRAPAESAAHETAVPSAVRHPGLARQGAATRASASTGRSSPRDSSRNSSPAPSNARATATRRATTRRAWRRGARTATRPLAGAASSRRVPERRWCERPASDSQARAANRYPEVANWASILSCNQRAELGGRDWPATGSVHLSRASSLEKRNCRRSQTQNQNITGGLVFAPSL